MSDSEHLAALRKGDVKAWNLSRSKESFIPELSGAHINPMSTQSLERQLQLPEDQRERLNLRGIDLNRSNFSGATLNFLDLTDANFSHSILGKATIVGSIFCRARMVGTKLNGAKFIDSDLTDANLSGAKLIKAQFKGRTNLSDADLARATLTGAVLDARQIARLNLVETNLTDVYSFPTRLWDARLYPVGESPEQCRLGKESIETTGALLATIKELKDFHGRRRGGIWLYFRGETRCGRPMSPSVMRNRGLRVAEGTMLVELSSRRPEDFVGASSALAQWVRAQHHGLPTRFLDITQNPLVGLYNACRPTDAGAEAPEDGRLHVLAVPPSLVKPFTSDTIGIVANLAKLPHHDQKEIVGVTSSRDEPMRRLYQAIHNEKPYFDKRIDPRDFYRVLIVVPQRSAERLRAQAGAFLVSAFHERFERSEVLRCNPDIPIYAHYELTVPSCRKQEIIEELRLLGITKETLFPGLDTSAVAIREEQRVP